MPQIPPLGINKVAINLSFMYGLTAGLSRGDCKLRGRFCDAFRRGLVLHILCAHTHRRVGRGGWREWTRSRVCTSSTECCCGLMFGQERRSRKNVLLGYHEIMAPKQLLNNCLEVTVSVCVEGVRGKHSRIIQSDCNI